MTEQADSSAFISGHPASAPSASANEGQGTKRARATKSRTNDPNRTIEKLSFTIDVNGDLGFLWDLNESYPGMRATELRRLLRMGIAAEKAGMQTSRMAGAIDAKQEDLQIRFLTAPIGQNPSASTIYQARETAAPAPQSLPDHANPTQHPSQSSQSTQFEEKTPRFKADTQAAISKQPIPPNNVQKVTEKSKGNSGRASGKPALGFLG